MILEDEEIEKLSKEIIDRMDERISYYVKLEVKELYDRYLNIPEVADLLGKSRDAVYKMISRGTIKCEIIKGKKLIPIMELRGLIKGSSRLIDV